MRRSPTSASRRADERLQAVVSAHIADGILTTTDLAQTDTLSGRDGTPLEITVTDDALAVGAAAILEPDLAADNGGLSHR